MKKLMKGFMTIGLVDFWILATLLVLIGTPLQAQSPVYGVIEGKVSTPDGEPLPGVEVTVSSPKLIGGAQSQITDNAGKYRFVALPPGTYVAGAKLQGFTPQQVIDLRLIVGATLTVDFSLKVGALEETVEVVGTAPIIDVKDSQMGVHNMPKLYLEKIPSSRDFEDQLAFAPGAKGAWGSFYGSPDSLENKFMTDGVNTTNPEDGAPAQLIDYDSIEEYNVMGIASPAEYGGFGGALVNVVTKSGGNRLQGLFTYHMRSPGWHSENWGNYPDLARSVFSEFYNLHFNIGGPIAHDKAWFYVSSRYSYDQDHIVDEDDTGEKSTNWRGLGKITWQMSRNDRLSATLDGYTGSRSGWTWEFVDPSIDYPREGHGFFYNVSYLHIFSNTTFLEARLGGMDRTSKSGNKTPAAHFDMETEVYTGNYWEYWDSERKRLDINASLSHHAEDFIKGSHDFKFGVEFARMPSQDWRGYPGDRYYLDLAGEPYFMTAWTGFNPKPVGTQISAFIQDSWTISDRITINPGIRIMKAKGALPNNFDSAPFDPKLGFAPRLGLNFDILGDHTTILKLHYGKYFHQMRDLMYTPWEPQGPYQEYIWGGVLNMWAEEEYEEAGEWPEEYPWPDDWILDFEDPWEPYKVDPNLKFPYMQQFVVGIERELGRDVSISASYIHRTNHNLMDRINLTGQWEPVQWTDPYDGNTFNVYQRLNPGENSFYVTNPKKGEDYGAAFPNIVGWDPERSNRTFELRFNKRYSNRWQLQASFVTGYSWGNDDNFWGEYGSSHSTALGASWNFSNPNYQINAEGPLTLSSSYLFKMTGSYDIPTINITMGFDFRYEAGDLYTKSILLDPDIDPDGVGAFWVRDVYIFAYPRGKDRLPAMKNLNLRAEWNTRFGENMRIGILLDIFNVFNWDTVAWVETYQDPWSEYQYGHVWDIQNPRAFKLGFRFEF